MKSFKDWLKHVEDEIAQEVATSSGGGTGSTSTGDIAGNPYGAGITYYDKKRDNYGLLNKKKCKDKVGGCDDANALGGKVIPMAFTGGKPVP